MYGTLSIAMTTRNFSMKIGVCHSLGAENPIKSNRERVQLYIVSVYQIHPIYHA